MSLPILFSDYFKCDAEAFDQEGLLDPFVEVDLQLFIDPLLLAKSSNKLIATEGSDAFRAHFEQLVRLLMISEAEGDVAWRAAESLLSLREPPENGLGYGKAGRSGSSRPARIRRRLLATVLEIIRLGSKDPEMISLMGFLEDEVGSDTISDFTTRAIVEPMAKVTHAFCTKYGIETSKSDICDTPLPIFRTQKGAEKPMLLVPKDIVRHLPVTENWSGVWEAIEHNRALRDKVSRMLAGVVKPTIAEQKHAVRQSVMTSSAAFEDFLNAVRAAAKPYDANEDVFGFYALRDYLAKNPLPQQRESYDLKKGPEEVYRVVLDALRSFQQQVENGDLWEFLWSEGKPKRERAAQLLFYAVAYSHCKANNVEFSGEPRYGGGPVDFSFSYGFNSRVIVEMKRSSGSVESGYEKQLDAYRDAAETDFAVFVVIDYGDAGQKIRSINRMRQDQIARGRRASDIIIIDARKKIAPSKRR